MQIGVITLDGSQVGVVSLQFGTSAIEDTFVPNLEGYEPQGRADRAPGADAPGGPSSDHKSRKHRDHGGGGGAEPGERSSGVHRPGHHASPSHPYEPGGGYMPPEGKKYDGGEARPVHQGSAETDQAIVDAARAHGLDVNTMRGIASIESGMNPSSNANRSTQYKGLYQVGREEWGRFGQGNIYSARDNAMATARMFAANRDKFRGHYGRDPTDAEMYLMHQQGLGFYTRGAMTNIGGNPYPGMRGPQSHDTFEAGWGRELARRKAGFMAREKPAEKPAEKTSTDDKPFDPETQPL